MTPTNPEFGLLVTHIEAENTLLKIWGQYQDNKAISQRIDGILQEAKAFFAQGIGCVTLQSISSSSGSVCCAKYLSDEFYRIKILELRPDGTVEAQFLDYGNTEIIPLKDVRSIDKAVIPNAMYLLTQPPQAHSFILANVLPTNGHWEKETLGALKKSVQYKRGICLIQSVVGGYTLVKVKFDNVDFGELLLRQNVVVPCTPQQMFSPQYSRPPQKIHRQPHQPGPYDNYHLQRVSSMESRVSPLVVRKPLPPDPANHRSMEQCILEPQVSLSYKSHSLEIGSTHEVFLSFVEDGPLLFSIQLKNDRQILENLMYNIDKFPKQQLKEPPIIGTVCLGRLAEYQKYCRALVVGVTESKCKLFYVDYGHTEVQPYMDIFQLPSQFINPHVLTVRFCLSGLRELKVTPEMKEFFKQYVLHKEFVLHVQDYEGPPITQYCDLFDNGKSVKNILKEKFPLATSFLYPEPARLPIGSRENVTVSFVESCNNFYVQLTKESPALDAIMNSLQTMMVTSKSLHPSQLSLGLPCAAVYETDGQWYRAQITEIMGDKVKVYYVDYGNEDTVPILSLRTIHNDLITNLRAQAIRCMLKGYCTLKCDEKTAKNFSDLASEKTFSMKVIDVLSNGLMVDLVYPNQIPLKSIQVDLDELNSNTPEHKAKKNYVAISPFYQRFDVRKQPALVLQQKPKPKTPKVKRDENNKWNNQKVHTESWRSPDDNSILYETPTSNRKEDENESKYSDNRYQKNENDQTRFRMDSNNRFTPGHKDRFTPGQKDRFNPRSASDRFTPTRSDSYNASPNERNSPNKSFNYSSSQNDESSPEKFTPNRNDRFNHDNQKTPRYNRDNGEQRNFGKNDWNNKSDDSRESRSGGRGGAGKFPGNNTNSRSDAEKNWSDKDSDSSTQSSSRKDRSGNNRGGSGNRRDARGLKNDSINRNEGENERTNFKSGRSNGGYNSNAEFRDKRSNKSHSQNQSNQNCSWDTTASSLSKPSPEKESSKIIQQNIPMGSVKSADVIYVRNPTDFYIHVTPECFELDTLMSEIAAVYETDGKLLQQGDLRAGLDCIAQYSEDQKWYRAVIKDVEVSGAKVLFVDYGNVEVVGCGKLKELEPKFTKLPAQAIPCKLLAASKDQWDVADVDTFTEMVDGQTVEVEFVSKSGGFYEVLLRQVEEETSQGSCSYVNDKFSNGADLKSAKESAKIARPIASGSAAPVFASLDSKYEIATAELGIKQDVIVTWFTNPDNFYCQLLSKENEFRTMMNEIQRVYVKRQPITDAVQVGSPVIAVFSDDGAFYRAEITGLNKLRGHIVQYIDFGNCAMVDPRQIYPIETRFMKFPKQAVYCCLKNIVPSSGSNWSKSNVQEIDKCFDADKFQCIFHEVHDNKYVASLSNNGTDVAGVLVEKGLASYAVSSPAKVSANSVEVTVSIDDVQRVDINLLPGQLLRVKVSNVESVNKFYIQLPSAAECEQAVADYMASKDSTVMPHLSCREVCLGSGCLVYSAGVWRRAVVINCSRTTGFDVRLIDTGAHDEITLDCMLALPSQLSVMQNQAVECCIQGVSSSLTVDEKLKDLVEDKEVLVYVDEVDNNRLLVELYDLSGNKIRLQPDEAPKKISPICSLPILSSTHQVAVSYGISSTCIWLQKESDCDKLSALQEKIAKTYPASGKPIEPEVGSVCVAECSDGCWYRAKILSVSETMVEVLFLDYGNIEEVSHKKIMELTPDFYEPHQQAVEVSLPVTLPGTVSEQLKVLQKYISAKGLTAVFYNVHKKWVAELLNNGEKVSDKLRENEMILAETKSSQIVEPEIQDMVIGDKYEMTVSHVDSPSQFWLQRKEELGILDELQAELQESVPEYPDMVGIPEEGSICAAVYSIDNSWYRAEVLDADEDITTVRFIDYGNTDVISNGVGNLKQIPESLKTRKKYALKCRLDVVPNNSEDWSSTVAEAFEAHVTSVDTIEAIVLADSTTKRVELFVNNQSVSEMLIKNGVALMINNTDNVIDEYIDQEMAPGSAFVSHIISPNEFWVQEEKNIPDLEIISDRFMVAEMLPKIDEVKENLLCVAKFPEDDQWYRAVVQSQGDNGTEVIYIDYGNSAISQELREIPQDLAAIPALSRKCSLQLPENVQQWSKKACEEFIRMSADGATIFMLDVVKEEDGVSVVNLKFEDESVSRILAEFCDQSLPIERLPPLGEENSPVVVISHINSPAEFWVQADNKMNDLNLMADHLKDAGSFLPLESYESGTICAANFPEDGLWYRAKILSHGELGTEVLYIDYGNSAVTQEVRVLPNDIVNIPVLSKRCGLQLPAEVESWSEAACEKFLELSADGATMFQFEILQEHEESTQVNLTLDGNNVADLLAALCEKKTPQEAEPKSTTVEEITEQRIQEKPVSAASSCEEISTVLQETITSSVFTSVSSATSLSKMSEIIEPQKETETEAEIDPVEDDSGVNVELEKNVLFSEGDEERKIEEEEKEEKALQQGEILKAVERRPSTPREDKIVPGSITKGLDLSLVDTEKELLRQEVAREAEEAESIVSEKVEEKEPKHDLSPVDDLQRPPTPKIPFSEKLVAGVLTMHEDVEEEKVETPNVSEEHSSKM